MLIKYGIDQLDNIILYGKNNIGAYRLAILLLHFGFKDVRVLDGGFNQWSLRKFPIEEGATK